MKQRFLNLLVFLTAVLIPIGCGGGARANAPLAAISTATSTATSAAQGTPYYPLAPGTHLAYSIERIAAARWTGEELLIDASEPQPGYLVLEYSAGAAANCPAFGRSYGLVEYAFTGSTDALPSPPLVAHTLGDVQASAGGVAYMGEAVQGQSTTEEQAEPLITIAPREGEKFSITTRVDSCSTGAPLEEGFALDYATIRHLASWHQFSDVWQTSLVERHASGAVLYYDYRFARGVGMVGLDCWTDSPDYYSCGNSYAAVQP